MSNNPFDDLKRRLDAEEARREAEYNAAIRVINEAYRTYDKMVMDVLEQFRAAILPTWTLHSYRGNDLNWLLTESSSRYLGGQPTYVPEFPFTYPHYIKVDLEFSGNGTNTQPLRFGIFMELVFNRRKAYTTDLSGAALVKTLKETYLQAHP